MPKNDDDFDFDKILKSLLTLGEKLVQNDRGVSFLAVVAGITLKQIPRRQRVRAEFRGDSRVQEGLATMSEDAWCNSPEGRKAVNVERTMTACEYEPEIAVDLFPINNLFGLPIDPNLGKVPISDLLIAMGAFGVGGGFDAIAKLIEIIKPKIL